jgi:hypothetical protein
VAIPSSPLVVVVAAVPPPSASPIVTAALVAIKGLVAGALRVLVAPAATAAGVKLAGIGKFVKRSIDVVITAASSRAATAAAAAAHAFCWRGVDSLELRFQSLVKRERAREGHAEREERERKKETEEVGECFLFSFWKTSSLPWVPTSFFLFRLFFSHLKKKHRLPPTTQTTDKTQ